MNKGYRKNEILHPQPKKALQGLGNGLGEPVSAIIGASIGAGMSLYGSISNYNKAVEADRAADAYKWSTNANAFLARLTENEKMLSEGEGNLILEEIKSMQNGLGYVLPSEMQDPYTQFQGVGAKNLTELIDALYYSLNYLTSKWLHIHKTYGDVNKGFFPMISESIKAARGMRTALRKKVADDLFIKCKIDEYMYKKILNHNKKATFYPYDRDLIAREGPGDGPHRPLPDEKNISDAELEGYLQLLRPQKQCMIENGAIVQTGSGTGAGGRSEADILGSEFYKNKNFQIGAAVVGGTLVVGTALYFIFRPKPTV